MGATKQLEQAIARLRDPAPKARSLILTAWGDTVFAFGGQVWLGSLVPLMAPLGLDERLVRTSVQRLVADNWLESRPFGNKRDIVMAPRRVHETQVVQKKIYSDRSLEWDGKWHLVIANPTSAARRESLRRELTWLGYAGLSPNQYIHPQDRWLMAETRLSAKGLMNEIAYRFDADLKMEQTPLTELWPLEALRADWQTLAESYEAMCEAIDVAQQDARTCFMLRTLAVHAIRRVILRDPNLPQHLLPEDSYNLRARKAFREIWTALRDPADEFAGSVLARSQGTLVKNDTEYAKRFTSGA